MDLKVIMYVISRRNNQIDRKIFKAKLFSNKTFSRIFFINNTNITIGKTDLLIENNLIKMIVKLIFSNEKNSWN